MLAGRLRSLGFVVDATGDGLEGAVLALSNPPDAVIADLWMPGVSGVQLCRLLRSEVATSQVPVLLRGDEDDRHHRFWAERAGASAFLGRGRVGELVRALRRAIAAAPARDEFFLQFGTTTDIHDRIARHLDAALFESIVAAEVRALGSCDTCTRLFDELAQFVSQLHPYRWLALDVRETAFRGLHHHPANRGVATAECNRAMAARDLEIFALEDADAVSEGEPLPPFVARIDFGGREVGTLAMGPVRDGDSEASTLVRILASALGGPLRTVTLVEQMQELATTDALTRVSNRRAFLGAMEAELARIDRHSGYVTIGLLDVDHFKQVNDVHGHAAGDGVLRVVAERMRKRLRRPDIVARWGGEEFVFALPQTRAPDALCAAEDLRAAIADAPFVVDGPEGPLELAVTASFGVAERIDGESLDSLLARADAAMYRAKQTGRNRVVVAERPVRLRAVGTGTAGR